MTDTPACGRSKRDGSGESCSLPAGWGTDHVGDGACKLHGGGSTGPNDTSKTKMNGTTHGVRAEDPAGLFAVLEDDERAWVEQWADAWRSRAGLDEDDPANMFLRLSAVRMYQAMTGERVVAEADNEHEKVVGVTDDGRPITDPREHYLAVWADRHMKSALRALKDVPNLPGGDDVDGQVDAEIVARFERIASREE
jgi:hypothetical protein